MFIVNSGDRLLGSSDGGLGLCVSTTKVVVSLGLPGLGFRVSI